MQRISTLSRLLNKFGVGKDGFKDGDLANGITATNLNADWCNGLQEEVISVIEQAGLTPSNATLNQLMMAIATLQRQQTNTAYTTAGTAPAFTVTLPASAVALAALGTNLRLRLKFHAAGAGSDTLNIGGLGAKSLKQYDYSGTKIAAVIASGQLADIEYDGTDFVILDPLPAMLNGFLTGMSVRWPSAIPPAGWLIRNGAAVSRTAYAALFAVIGTTFGAGDGSTTFNLPDSRDRMSIGAGNLYALGATGGNKDAVVVSHNHAVSISDPGHSHSINYQGTLSFSGGGGYGNTAFGGSPNQNTNANTTGISASIGTTGSSATGANLPPYIADYSIIKY
jgi:microcystin-dependent protein